MNPVSGRPLRVALVCGCAEGGADGVGDYTEALAGVLRGRGVDARIAAVRDPFVADPVPDGPQARSGTLGPSAMQRPLGPGSSPGFRRGAAGMTRLCSASCCWQARAG